MFRSGVAKMLAAVLLVAVWALILAPVSLAQDYRFNVKENRVDVYIEQDGTVFLVYDLTFTPDPGSHPIDVVDDYPEIVRPLVQLEARVPGSWYLNALATYPEHQGRGVASRLIEDSVERARRLGCNLASLIVASENGQAKRLYEHLGFSGVASRPVIPYPGCLHGGDWILMTRPI